MATATGYAWLKQLTSPNTAKITEEFFSIFNSFGWPTAIRTDRRPQFRQEFKNFFKVNALTQKIASARNHLVEAAVKN